VIAADKPAGDVIVFCSHTDAEKKHQLEAHGVRVEVVPEKASPSQPVVGPALDLHCVLERLGAMKITSLLVEGGATVNWACLSAGLVDKLWLFYAPKILGGYDSVPLIGGDGFVALSDAPQLRELTLHRYGEDFAVEGYLRDPYA
jgi:diaminohydroxyphosphoribosylaminopyrimidine deaminase/5-amino-6-(5-phosphoribosylamino)uracil reductase